MTNLYRLDTSAADVAERFGARLGEDPWQCGYGAPGKFAPVVTAGRDFIAGPRPAKRRLEPRITPRLWGVLPPPRADDPTRRIATIRNPDSPFWIGNLRNSEFRCLIPATAFMLWGSGTDYEGRRLQHWFAPPGERVFALAGVWKDEEVPAFAILTGQTSGGPRQVGARTMPLVLPDSEEARQQWLHAGWDTARALLEPGNSATASEIDRPISRS